MTFNGTSGSVSDIMVILSGAPVGATDVIESGTGVEIDFSSPLITGAGVEFTFQTELGTSLSVRRCGHSNRVPPTAPNVSIITTGGVPEPGSMVLLGIGSAGLLSFRRFFRRKAVV